MNVRTGLIGVRNAVVRTVKKRAPEILTGVGIGGMISSTVLAVKATPEAMHRLKTEKKRKRRSKLTLMETIRAAWKCYIPAVVVGGASAACLIGANTVQGRRNAALTVAASVAETSLKEYRDKVTETIGKKKETAIRDAIDRDRIERDPPPANTQAPVTNGLSQPVLCYDAMFGRYFYSDIETLRRAVNELNWQMNNATEPYISLNEFYESIGLEPVDVGDELGWRSDKGLIELRFSSQLVNGQTPCLVMSHLNPPEYGYSIL